MAHGTKGHPPPGSHHHHVASLVSPMDKWLWKVALLSLVLLTFSVCLMFKLNNIDSLFAWPVVFLPLWLGFAVWIYFVYSMLRLRWFYRSRAGAVPPSPHLIILNIVWLAALLAFAIEVVVVLSHGGFPLVIRPTLLFLPILIAAGISLFAPVLPYLFKPNIGTYSLYEAGAPGSSRTRVSIPQAEHVSGPSSAPAASLMEQGLGVDPGGAHDIF